MSNIAKPTGSEVASATGAKIANRTTTQPGPVRDNIRDAEFTVVAENLVGDMKGNQVRIGASKGASKSKKALMALAIFVSSAAAFAAGQASEGKIMGAGGFADNLPSMEQLTNQLQSLGASVRAPGAKVEQATVAPAKQVPPKPAQKEAAPAKTKQDPQAKTKVAKPDSRQQTAQTVLPPAVQAPVTHDTRQPSAADFQAARNTFNSIAPTLFMHAPDGTKISLSFGDNRVSTTIGAASGGRPAPLTDAQFKNVVQDVTHAFANKIDTAATLTIEAGNHKANIQLSAPRQMTRDDAASMLQNYRQNQVGQNVYKP